MQKEPHVQNCSYRPPAHFYRRRYETFPGGKRLCHRQTAAISGLQSQSTGAAGAVISLALSSSIIESAEEVFLKLKSMAPRTPVLFAAMLSLEQARPALERIAKQAGLQANILGVEATSAAAAQLGRQETFLYLSKDDLTFPERRATAARLVQRHFR